VLRGEDNVLRGGYRVFRGGYRVFIRGGRRVLRGEYSAVTTSKHSIITCSSFSKSTMSVLFSGIVGCLGAVMSV